MPIRGRPEAFRPSYDALLERLRRNFLGQGVPKAERAEPLDFELILNPEEAQRGLLIPFEIPTFSVCCECGGLGRYGPASCAACDGEGRLVEHEAVDVRVPAGVLDDTVIEVSLRSLGIENLWLRVHVRIERH
jgi:hypothetical protein